jgi:hypothetical protein
MYFPHFFSGTASTAAAAAASSSTSAVPMRKEAGDRAASGVRGRSHATAEAVPTQATKAGGGAATAASANARRAGHAPQPAPAAAHAAAAHGSPSSGRTHEGRGMLERWLFALRAHLMGQAVDRWWTSPSFVLGKKRNWALGPACMSLTREWRFTTSARLSSYSKEPISHPSALNIFQAVYYVP